jgi:hypothetical protein
VKRRVIALTLASAAALAPAVVGCRGGGGGAGSGRLASLEEVLRPAPLAVAMRKLGGAHFHATTRMGVTAGGRPAAGTESSGGVTTTTDAWLDRTGNYRIVESNDQDGGREVVLAGRDLYVALRYGKMIRRVAEQPEPDRLLQEALGGPWAAWEIAAPFAVVEAAGTQLIGGVKATGYRVTRSDRAVATAPTTGAEAEGARQWRATLAVQKLDGRIWVDDATGALLASELAVAFTGKRGEQPGAQPIEGKIDVRSTVDGVASTPPVVKPAAEELALRQRIVPEQKELLGGLPSAPGGLPSAPSSRAPSAPAKGKRP